ncbi:MAG: hypothetical protein QOJ80_2089 [Mycobacterium sp.]|jgi:hypothetical protein|nr:hypothetical protein [Mycobacterium sp.]
MTTSNPGLRLRSAATLTLVALGAAVVSLFGATTTANAAPDAYVAISVGLGNDNPPVVTIGGMSIGPDADQARIASLSNCQNNGGNHCVFEMSATNACAAAAANDYGEIEAAQNPSVQAAESSAMSKLQNQQGAHVVVSGCANGQVSPPPPPSSPPPAPPKQGPTVSFKTIVGGLQAHITDRSGVTSQCTYVTDDVNRSFALAANASYDLKIVPAVPRFRTWNVTITCDNGTSTQATTYF